MEGEYMSRITKIVCDVCGTTDDEALYLVGSDAADIHLCNYCLDEMNHRAIEYLESHSTDIKAGGKHE